MKFIHVCRLCGEQVEKKNLKKHIFEKHVPTDFFDIVLVEGWDETD